MLARTEYLAAENQILKAQLKGRRKLLDAERGVPGRLVIAWAAMFSPALAPTSFTAEVVTLRGLVTYYVLFFIHLENHRVEIAGIAVHPDEVWMKQMAPNATMDDYGVLLVVAFSCMTGARSSPVRSAQSLPQ